MKKTYKVTLTFVDSNVGENNYGDKNTFEYYLTDILRGVDLGGVLGVEMTGITVRNGR
jgi:hypothetical protein